MSADALAPLLEVQRVLLQRYRDALVAFYRQDWDRLAPLAVASSRWLGEALGVVTPVVLASALGVEEGDPADDATARLVAFCRAVGADTYLAGQDGARYMDTGRFAAAGITVQAQRYEHPVYAQLNGEFAPFLSALDLLLMHGDEALPILCGGSTWSCLSP